MIVGFSIAGNNLSGINMRLIQNIILRVGPLKTLQTIQCLGLFSAINADYSSIPFIFSRLCADLL